MSAHALMGRLSTLLLGLLLGVGFTSCQAGPEEDEAETGNATGLILGELIPISTESNALVAHPRPIVWDVESLRSAGMSPYMRDGLERLLIRHSPELNATYQRFLAEDPMLSGRVTAHITTESGVFLFCSLEANTTGSEALGTALFGQMADWDWPRAGREVFRLHLHLRRSLGSGAGFADAGSRHLLPEPPPLPVYAEQEPVDDPPEGVEELEQRPLSPDEAYSEQGGVGSTPEAFESLGGNGDS